MGLLCPHDAVQTLSEAGRPPQQQPLRNEPPGRRRRLTKQCNRPTGSSFVAPTAARTAAGRPRVSAPYSSDRSRPGRGIVAGAGARAAESTGPVNTNRAQLRSIGIWAPDPAGSDVMTAAGAASGRLYPNELLQHWCDTGRRSRCSRAGGRWLERTVLSPTVNCTFLGEYKL